MRAADTNILLRLIERDDAKQAAAAEAAIAEGPLWVSPLVLLEMVWVLETGYQRSKREIMKVLEVLITNGDLVLEAPNVVSAALALWAKGTAGFADYLILEYAAAAGHAPLLTFDKRLAKAPGTRIPKP